MAKIELRITVGAVSDRELIAASPWTIELTWPFQLTARFSTSTVGEYEGAAVPDLVGIQG